MDTPCDPCTVGYHWLGGYKRISRNGKMVYAHRWAYEQVHGPVPDGLEIGHLCHNPECWNVDHLRAMTHAENMRQRSERQTHCKHGHEFTKENTTVRNNRRHCKACARDRYHRDRKLKVLLESVIFADNYFSGELDKSTWSENQYQNIVK